MIVTGSVEYEMATINQLEGRCCLVNYPIFGSRWDDAKYVFPIGQELPMAIDNHVGSVNSHDSLI